MNVRRATPWVVTAILAAMVIWFLTRDEETALDPSETEGSSISSTPRPARSKSAGQAERSQAADAPLSSAGMAEPLELYSWPSEVQPSSGPRLSGRIVSRLNGKGVEGAEVTFAKEGSTRSVFSDTHGDFQFTAAKPGIYQLASVVAEGFTPFAPIFDQSPLTFEAREGHAIRGIRIALDPKKKILGRVIDPSGAPIEDARIFVRSPSAGDQVDLVLDPSPQRSDAQGRFQFSAPVDSIVEAHHPGFASVRTRLTRSAWTRGEVVLQFKTTNEYVVELTITGTVVDEHGAGLEGVALTAFHEPRTPFNTDQWWSARSDEAGSFTFTGLEAGSYSVRASTADYVTAEVDGVQAGTQGLRIELGSQGGFIVGQVVAQESGESISSFAVLLTTPHGKLEERVARIHSFLDAEGRFRIGPLAEQPYQVRVLASRYVTSDPQSVRVSKNESVELLVALLSGSRLGGRVIDAATRSPIAGANVALEGGLSDQRLPLPVHAATVTDDAGHFELQGLPNDRLSVFASAYGYDSRVVDVIHADAHSHRPAIEIPLTPMENPDEEPKVDLSGIGAMLGPQGDVIVVGDLVEEGGAAEAGLQPGDEIIAIDGQSVGDMDFNMFIQQVRGRADTSLVLRIRHDGETRDVTVYRRQIRG